MALLESIQRAQAESASNAPQTVLYTPDVETKMFLAAHEDVRRAAQDAITAICKQFDEVSVHVLVMCDPDTSDQMLSIEIRTKMQADEARSSLRHFMRNLPASVEAIEDKFLFSMVRV